MKKLLAALPLLSLTLACPLAHAAAQVADSIWFNGPVITINDAQPLAEAVAVRNGRISAVGKRNDIMKLKGRSTRLVDLQGKTLLPGFVDAHSHISMVGLQAVSANLLPPPDGGNASVADLQATLRDFIKSSALPKKFGITMGFGYDDSQLKEQRHPERQELDAIASDRPILIIHQSGHLGVLNSKALAMAGITAQSVNPAGGVIRREKDSQQPNGVLEESAFFSAMMKLFPQLTPEQAIAMLEEGQKLYLRYGYTTIQDGRTSAGQVLTAIAAAKKGRFKADVVSYPDILEKGSTDLLKAPWYHDTRSTPQYRSHFRIGGVKLTLDGSPQGKTAWLSQPYFIPPAGLAKDYAGYGVVKDDKVLEVYTRALQQHWQILTHANGDRAIDQLLDNMQKAESTVPGVDVRPVLIHGQVLREDQIDRLQALKVFPSLFPMHTFYWGDWHRESVLGAERAENISPTGWLVQRGMMFTTHHDAPVAFPDSIRVLAATVNRTTRTGHVLGPQQRVEPIVALKAMTLWAAYQHFEEKSKGSLETGKLADFVVLSDNPLTMPRESLESLQVLQTVKEGKVIWTQERSKPAAMASCMSSDRCFEGLARFNGAAAHSHRD